VVIGIEVFEKLDYDPKKHSTVKVAMGDLRKCLSEYYSGAGRNDRVIITLKKGSNVPRFKLNRSVVALDLDNQALMLVAQVRADMDQGLWTNGITRFYLNAALHRYPQHPRLVALSAMLYALEGQLHNAEWELTRHGVQNSTQWECVLTEAWLAAALHWDWQKAGVLFERANALSSGEAGIYHSWYATFLASQLRFEEAEAVTQDALVRSSYARTGLAADLALFQIIAGNLVAADSTVRLLMHRVEVEKSEPLAFLPVAYRSAAFLSAARGDYRKAAALVGKTPLDASTQGITLALQALFHGLDGNRAAAQERYAVLSDLFCVAYQPISSFHLGLAASGAGDDEYAIGCFTSAAESHDPSMILIGVLPFTRHLHSHVGFRELVLQKMKLNFPS
jgi:Tfp pilus assembly protein PilF